jgi:preprotein translocase YajC subunit
MTVTPAVAHLVLATTSKSSSSSLLTLLPLVAIGLLGYFFFIRPQQRKAQAARQAQGSGYEVGDEVQTVGGVIGTILEIHGDRYTLLTGALGDDGNLDGPQPTRIVFVRQAIAKKVEPIDDVHVEDEPPPDVMPRTNGTSGTSGTSGANGSNGPKGSSGANGTGATSASAGAGSQDDDIDDVGGDSAASSGDLGGEAEEA